VSALMSLYRRCGGNRLVVGLGVSVACGGLLALSCQDSQQHPFLARQWDPSTECLGPSELLQNLDGVQEWTCNAQCYLDSSTSTYYTSTACGLPPTNLQVVPGSDPTCKAMLAALANSGCVDAGGGDGGGAGDGEADAASDGEAGSDADAASDAGADALVSEAASTE
jgi:hypothetical protein